jgi:hypothetical protein
MAQPAGRLDDRRLLHDYLRLLQRYGEPEDAEVGPGHEIRTCATCGQQAIFHIDPEGMWARCSHCEHFA